MSADGDQNRSGAPGLVLVVEDERSIAGFVAEVVAEAGYIPVLATNGREALERAQERWPALVVTDLMMPHLDGSQLVRALRDEAAAARLTMPPVILMTAANTTYARQAGADAVLPKPFTLDELEVLLQRFLG